MLLNDKDTTYALAVLRNNAMFKRLIQAMDDWFLSEAKKMVMTIDEVQLRQAQGKCQAILEFLSDFEAAPEVLKKFENKDPSAGIPAPPLNSF